MRRNTTNHEPRTTHGRVLLELEAQQEALIREKLGPRAVDVPVMTDQQRQEALELLQDPQLIARIQSDFDACGLVGRSGCWLLVRGCWTRTR